ncbi:MAG: ABC transporter permease [Ectothiorhodospiraceae bacterium]|nr:ABC transporter permease [Ectothiorhodospiraceae bacterium]
MSDVGATGAAEALAPPVSTPRSGASAWWRRLQAMPPSVRGAALILVVAVVVAAGARWMAPFSYQETDLLHRLQVPLDVEAVAAGHWLGTDKLGRDVLSRLLVATQVSVALALLGTVIGAVLGTALGILAAHRGGWVDELVMMMVDWQAAMPFLIIALAMLAFLGNSLALFVLLMGIFGWETYARLARGLLLSAREHGYAVAVRSLGASPQRLYLRHLLPNVMSPLVVQLSLNFPQTILLETSLSFLGLGIQPPLTSLGQMLGEGRDFLLTAWWLAVLPGSVIFATTLSMSILGDWLRARLDPTQRPG